MQELSSKVTDGTYAYASGRCRSKRLRRRPTKDIRTGLSDAVFHHDVHPRDLGQSVLLPASYTGSPRFMSRCYQDSMAIVRYFGRPAFFVTFTANPHWPEIQRELEKTPGLLLSCA